MPLAAAYKIFAWNQEKVIVIVPFFVKVVQTAVAHRGQSRALRLCRFGRVQRYTPAPYSAQN